MAVADNLAEGTYGPVFVVDRAYKPRVHAKRAPDAGYLSYDIKDDSVSIMTHAGILQGGDNSTDVAEDWPESAAAIERYSEVS